MSSCEYEALVSLVAQDKPGAAAALPGPECRAVVEITGHDGKPAGELFSALVSVADGTAHWPGDHDVIVLLHLIGDDPGHLHPGDRFALWRDGVIGHGVISRRRFV